MQTCLGCQAVDDAFDGDRHAAHSLCSIAVTLHYLRQANAASLSLVPTTKHHEASPIIAKHHKASKSEFCPSCRSIDPIGLMSLHPGCLAWLPPSGTRPGNACLSRHGRPLQRSQAQRRRRTLGKLGCEEACTAHLDRQAIWDAITQRITWRRIMQQPLALRAQT